MDRATDRVTQSKIKLDGILTKLNLLEFPSYLRDLLSYSGFDNYTSLCELNEGDLKNIEDFAKNVLPELLDEHEKDDFFGIFKRKPALFRIVDGDLKLLNNLKEKCKKISVHSDILSDSATELSNVSQNRKRKTAAKNVPSKSTESKKIKCLEVNDSINDEIEDKMQERKLTHLKNRVKEYLGNFLNKLPINLKEESLPLLDTLDVKLGTDCAYIKCPNCPHISKAYSEFDKGTWKWVTSNVNRHFKTHYRIHYLGENISENPKHKKDGTLLSFLQKKSNSDFQDPSLAQSAEKKQIVEMPREINKVSEAKESEKRRQNEIEDKELLPEDPDSMISDLYSDIPDESFSRGSSSLVEITEELIDEDNDEGHASGNAKSCSSDRVYRAAIETSQFSRRERRIKARVISFDENQLTLLDFYSFCDSVKTQIFTKPILKEQFQSAINYIKSEMNDGLLINEGPETFLEMIKASVINNSKKRGKSANRYSEDIKKMSLYLFLIGGRLTYETLISNLPNALPSLATIHRTLSNNGRYAEGKLNFEELKMFLNNRNYPPIIFVSEDQTALIKRVRYNPTTNQLTGIVLPLSKQSGFPEQDLNIVNTLFDIKNILETTNQAINAYVFMAQPMVEGAPAFCITLFGSENRFTAEDVLLRWQYLQEEAHKHGITLRGFSSDADSRCLKAMRKTAQLACSTISGNPYSPYFQANFDPKKPIVTQDTIHIATKFKSRILNPDLNLVMGKYTVSKKHLETLIESDTKDKHFLCSSYLDETDKMNFEAIDKMSAPCVTNLLMKNNDALGTAILLRIVRYVLDSYLDKSLTVLERVYKIWYSAFFLRLWRAWIKHQSNLALSKNWITLQTYACVELNAHALLVLIEQCRNHPKSFLPWLCSSQPCEGFFRSTRSMTSTFATVVNFDLLDLMHKQHRIETINNIITDTREKFIFPREENKRLGTNKATNYEIPEIDVIRNTIEDALKAVIHDAKKLAINLPEDIYQNAFETLSIPEILEFQVDFQIEGVSNMANLVAENTKENNMNDQDKQDIENDLKILENFETINIRDYSVKNSIRSNNQIVEHDSSLLKLKVKNKEILVKKSTICWLLSEKKGRLSSDRLLRCKNMSGKPEKPLSRAFKKRTKKIIRREISESDTDTDTECHVESEFEVESFSEDSDSFYETQDKVRTSEIEIKLEEYYAVIYDTWYIGRIVEMQAETCKIKFLKLELNQYIWPKNDDIQIVSKNFIFYGPIHLIGNGPFEIKRLDKIHINKKFKMVKKLQQKSGPLEIPREVP